jgi:hypothetical protein
MQPAAPPKIPLVSALGATDAYGSFYHRSPSTANPPQTTPSLGLAVSAAAVAAGAGSVTAIAEWATDAP